MAVSHERGFVEALRPTYCLRLPEERFTHWREEYLDDVEMRWRARYDTQIWVGQSTPSSKAMALEPCSVAGLAKFCTLGWR